MCCPLNENNKAVIRIVHLDGTAVNGRVKLEVYPNGTLYKDKEEKEAP
jgi:TRAP-type C4-dicarboxylate transport system substrate-binding protein